MKGFFTIASIVALAASKVAADIIDEGNGEVKCTGINYTGSFCTTDDEYGDLITRCYLGSGQIDNCADELDTPNAVCGQSSPTAGDAECYSSLAAVPTATATATATAVAGRVRV